jgi:hypothetical protein
LNLSAISTPVLQEWLNTTFTQYAAVRSGQKVTTANYTQGDGSMGVTFNNASIADLSNWISDLQRELARRGIGYFEPRRAISLNYGPHNRWYATRGRWEQL